MAINIDDRMKLYDEAAMGYAQAQVGTPWESHWRKQYELQRQNLVDAWEELESEIARLREAARWTPVSEQMPERENDGDFSIDVEIVLDDGPVICPAYYNYKNQEWVASWLEDCVISDWTVTHWRPKTKPPEVE